MESHSIQPFVALLVSSLISFRSYRKKSLDLSGALMGFLVMSVHIAAGYRYGVVLLVFFFTSSKLTKIGEEQKRRIDADFKEGGQRNWIQVLFNSGVSTILVVLLWKLTNWQDKCLDSKDSAIVTALMASVIGHYSCCNGDTWSSEIGVLSDARPRLITTFKPVRKGTNGGVTLRGLLAAAGGGFVIGSSFVVVGFFTTQCTTRVALKQLLAVPLATLSGLFGSILDSFLGATLQYSGFCAVRKKVVSRSGRTVKKISGLNILSNNGVNLVSILLTSIGTGLISMYIF